MNPNLISLIPTAASLGCHVVTFYTFNTTKLKRFSREGPPVLPESSQIFFIRKPPHQLEAGGQDGGRGLFVIKKTN